MATAFVFYKQKLLKLYLDAVLQKQSSMETSVKNLKKKKIPKELSKVDAIYILTFQFYKHTHVFQVYLNL